MCLLPVLLLGVLLCPGKGNGDREEIFTRPGSDLLIPIRRHLTLHHPDTKRCDWITWYYDLSEIIAEHRNCDLSYEGYFSNTRISVNGSLIISNVTLENDGVYRVHIYTSTGDIIQRDYYIIHVEGIGVQEEIFTRSGSDLLFPIRRHLILKHPDTKRCDWLYWFYQKFPGSRRIIAKHWSCFLSGLRHFPNTRISENGSLIISNVTLRNDGEYRMDIYNSAGHIIQRDYYTVHVEGNAVQEENIFTRLGSDLLIPIRRHLTLNRTDTKRCDGFYWSYEKPPVPLHLITVHRNCDLSYEGYFPNTRTSENGSLIISNVTPENDGEYSVEIYNSTGEMIQKDYYTVHVEVPVSVPVLRVSCLWNGSTEISCRMEAGTKPNISLSVIGGSQGKYSTSANNITAIVESPGPWNITCTARNSFSQSEESRAGVTCPDPVLDMRCLQNGSAEISCEVKNGTDPSIYLTVSGVLELYNFTSSEKTARVTVPPVSSPNSWNIRCSAKNSISERSTNQTYDTCPGERRSGWGHVLSCGAVFVLYTGLLIFS